ncbi:MAG TPA: sigma-70 family RNA polymerase sigma factor [Longimicrobiales bacterium]|nr:sigma-70 family RNA polymerase sigma factor [Longimicrobiales bacterium]
MNVDWAAVYRASYPALVRFLYRKVWDSDRAQELAQETFLRALSQAPDDPRAWLYRVAGNLARDEARRAARRKRHLALLEREVAAEGAVPPEGSRGIEQDEEDEVLRRALARLSERDRDALLLREAGLSYREIAAQLGLAPGAMGTTLARARQRLAAACSALEETRAARG